MAKSKAESARKELAAQIERMEDRLVTHAMSLRAKTPAETLEAQEHLRYEIEQLRKILGKFDGLILERKAARLGIDIPRKPEWYDSEIKDLTDGRIQGDPVLQKWLNQTGRTAVSNMINDAQFAKWNRWAGLLVPILALLVALVALFKDIIVEVLKK